MSKRIPWDEHEQAVLLQALIDVLLHKTERSQAISEVSRRLRGYAAARGIEIDEKFRNENGIRLQMNCLEYVYTGGQSGLHVTGGWFYNIIHRYKNDRESFERLLQETDAMIRQAADINDFQKWLENNEPMEAVEIFTSLKLLDILLRKNGVIRNHIFDISDINAIEDLILSLKKNRVVKLHDKKRRTITLKGLCIYKRFLESIKNGEDISPADEKQNLSTSKNEIDTEKEAEALIVSFTQKDDYSYTRPISVTCFEKTYNTKNWASLYVQTVNCLLAIHPEEIRSLIGKNIGGRGRVDISEAEGAREMLAPKALNNNLYLETNCSAAGIIDKIRQLMNICSEDYSVILIKYERKDPSRRTEKKPTNRTKGNEGLSNPNDEFYNWLTETEGLAAPTGRSYTSAINKCNAFCKEYCIGTGRLYGAESGDEIISNIDILVRNREFQELNNAGHHRYTAALTKYQQFLGLTTTAFKKRTGLESRHIETKKIATDEIVRIRTTLELPRFEYGFKDDGVELYRFRASYADVNGMECSLKDDELLQAIRGMGFEFEGKVYLLSEETMDDIETEIKGYADQGTNIIYYEKLYDIKSDDYFEAKIVSSEMLKEILKQLMPRFRYKNNYFALPAEKMTELELTRNDIIRVWGNTILQTFDDLSMKLPLIPLEKIKFTLTQQTMFIWNSAETYLCEDSFEADEEEIAKLNDFIDRQCEENGSVSLDDVPFENLKAQNPELSETALITCFYRLIEDNYDRNARILTRKGAKKDTYTAVFEFCQKHEKCTYSRLIHIAEKVAGIVRTPDIIEAANSAMVRIDKENFVADRLIYFDVRRIDSALDHIVTNEFIGMREITTFSTLPFCGYGWNLFLLESYCRRFSQKYKYTTRRANSSNSGAITVITCDLSYHDIMVEAVARSSRELNEIEVFDFLTEAGYMERKRYNEIERLINNARELRKRRK